MVGMEYLYSKCVKREDGSLVILPYDVARWQSQIDTSYSELSENEKKSDRMIITIVLTFLGTSLFFYWMGRDDGFDPSIVVVPKKSNHK